MAGHRRTVIAGLLAALAARGDARAEDADARPLQEGSGRADLDGDGAIDCWRLDYDGGSGYGWWTMSVQAPCDAAPIVVRLGGSLGEFVAIARLPDELAQRPRLLDGLLARWFGRAARRSLAAGDGSLRWLIDRYTGGEPADAVVGDWHIGPPYTPRWSTGRPELPGLEVIPLLAAPEQALGARLAGGLAVDDEPAPAAPYLVVYFAQNHHQLARVAGTADLAVHVTDHAIAVEEPRGRRWSWAFVATHQVRLRTPSIVRAATDGSLVAAELRGTGASDPHRLLVLDPRSGHWLWRDIAAGWTLDAAGLQIGEQRIQRAELAKLVH
jgi:hypothetical protein